VSAETEEDPRCRPDLRAAVARAWKRGGPIRHPPPPPTPPHLTPSRTGGRSSTPPAARALARAWEACRPHLPPPPCPPHPNLTPTVTGGRRTEDRRGGPVRARESGWPHPPSAASPSWLPTTPQATHEAGGRLTGGEVHCEPGSRAGPIRGKRSLSPPPPANPGRRTHDRRVLQHWLRQLTGSSGEAGPRLASSFNC
jgi:hypothetical protein